MSRPSSNTAIPVASAPSGTTRASSATLTGQQQHLNLLKQMDVKVTNVQALLENDLMNQKIKPLTTKDSTEILGTSKFPEQCRSYRLRTIEDEPVSTAVSLGQLKYLDETEERLISVFCNKMKSLEEVSNHLSEKQEIRQRRMDTEKKVFAEKFKRSHKELGVALPVMPFNIDEAKLQQWNLLSIREFDSVSELEKRPVSAPKTQKPLPLDTKQQAEVAKSLIKKFETRFRFLQNPQFQDLIQKKKVQRRAFTMLPELVLFDDYEPGQSYSQTFELKNVSPHCRRVRMILPEKPSPYFLLEPTFFPNNSGSVPPGLSCLFTVVFTPDSRRQYENEPLIAVDLGEVIKIPIKAKRRSVNIEFPEVLDCGVCRAGFTTHKSWDFVNRGNQGSGLIVAIDDASVLSPEEMKALHDNNRHQKELKIGPFTIQPAFFELDRSEPMKFRVLINPDHSEDKIDFDLRFTVIYDNFDTNAVRIKARSELPSFAITGVSEKQSGKFASFEPSAVFKSYKTAIDLGKQNLFAVSKRWFVVKSDAQIMLPFSWKMNQKSAANKTPHDIFTITPKEGTFEPMQELKFEVSFTSAIASKYELDANLTLSNSSEEFFLEDQLKPEEIGIATSLYAEALPHKLAIEPAIPDFPKSLALDEQFILKSKFANDGFSDFHYNTEVICDTNCVELVKTEGLNGDLAPGATKNVQIALKATTVGKATGKIQIKMNDGSTTFLPFSIDVLFPLDSITVDPPRVDYGILRKFKEQKTQFTLSNRSSRSLHWKLNVSALVAKSFDCCNCIIEPTAGTIQPKHNQTISVRFTGIQDGEVNNLFKFSASADNINFFEICHAQVQAIIETPKAVLLPAKIDLGMCYLGVEGQAQVTIKSFSLLDTTYSWLSRDCKDYSIRFSPANGVLKGQQTVETSIIFKPKRLGSIKNILIVCKVNHMEQNNGYLGVVMQAEATGFSYSYQLTPQLLTELEEASTGNIKVHERSVSDQKVVDFGKDCPIFGRRRRTLVLENKCAFEVPFSISFENFGASSQKEAAVLNQSDSKTPSNLIFENDGVGFKSKQGQLYSQTKTNSRAFTAGNEKYLREGHGVAFFAQPQSDVMPAFGKTEIHVYAVNNFWGEYEDTMTVTFKSWTSVEIPVSIGIVGTPLYFHGQASIDGSDSGINLSIVLADKHDKNAPLTVNKKTVLVENLSPKTLAIDWRSFKRQDLNKKRPVNMLIEPLQFLIWKKLQTRLTLSDQSLIEDGAPFDVEPKRLQLAPFSKGTISVQLRSKNAGAVTGFLYGDVGYVYAGRIFWAQRLDEVSTNFAQRTQAGPMILPLRGKVIDPVLELCSGKTFINVKCSPKDAVVLQDGSRVWKKQTPVRNGMDGTVAFTLKAEPSHFHAHLSAKKKDNMYFLNPNTEIFIQIEYSIPSGVPVKDESGFLEVLFCNGSIQRIPLHAIPSI